MSRREIKVRTLRDRVGIHVQTKKIAVFVFQNFKGLLNSKGFP